MFMGPVFGLFSSGIGGTSLGALQPHQDRIRFGMDLLNHIPEVAGT